jgi:hypothetical protein
MDRLWVVEWFVVVATMIFVIMIFVMVGLVMSMKICGAIANPVFL